MTDAMLTRRAILGGGATAALLAASPIWAQAAAAPAGDPALDALVTRFMAEFGMPGVGLAVVRKGQPDYVAGYGIRAMGSPDRVDAHTRFAIASNSKAFTTALLAMLVDEGKLGWDDPVVRYIPEFKLWDPAVTQMFTVRDLLVHRSGLPLGAGDLMLFDRSDRPASAVLAALQHLKPGRGFRSGYDYDNLLYIVAGLVIERLSGRSWAEFASERLFRPLGMADAGVLPAPASMRNVAGRHARLGPPVRGMGPLKRIEPYETASVGAAGGILASVTDITGWLKVQLGQGALPDGSRLWSEKQAAELWKPQTITGSGVGPTPESPTRPVLAAYALGWFVQDMRGTRLIHHSGGLEGQVTYTGLLPEKGIGFALFNNSEEPGIAGLRGALIDHLLGGEQADWIAITRKRKADAEAQVAKSQAGAGATAPAGGPSLPLARYAGRYRDPWYGEIAISQRGGGLFLDFLPSPLFKGRLEPWGPDTFRAHFPEGAESPLVMFKVEGGRVAGITMKAFSPLADFSFDYHDLNFVPA